MNYEVVVSKRVVKEVKAIPMRDQKRVREAIRKLATNPRPRNSIKLQGSDSLYRVRSGDYRMIYEIDDGTVRVYVVRVRHRRDVYG